MGHPETFNDVVARVRAMRLRPEMELAEAPPPRRMAPQTLALTADVVIDDEEVGTGRLVVLHNADGEEAWAGTTRLVLYLDAAVERELAEDPLLPEVGWTWLEEALDRCAGQYWALGGTVTRVQSESFAALADRGAQGRIQLRASWTAADLSDLPDHVLAWSEVLATASGLEPIPEGVTVIGRRHSSL